MAVNLRAYLTGFRTVLVAICAFTETKLDDQAVAGLDALLASDEFLDWLQGTIDQPEGALSISAPSESLKLELIGRGVNWQKLVEFLPTLIALLKLIPK